MINLKKEIELIINTTSNLFYEYLNEHREQILQIPKLAFLSLYKKTTKDQTRFLMEISTKNILKLISSKIHQQNFSYAIYLDCIKNKFILFDGRDVPKTKLLSSYLENKENFDIDLIYKNFVFHSQEELHEDVFFITKTKRRDKKETAYNYFSHLLEKSNRTNIKLTFEDLKTHIAGNKTLNNFLKTEEDFQKIKDETIIRFATKLLNK